MGTNEVDSYGGYETELVGSQVVDEVYRVLAGGYLFL